MINNKIVNNISETISQTLINSNHETDQKLLTIGMATYNDFDGVYFTVQSIRFIHQICQTDKVEFLIIDNNPNENDHSKALQRFLSQIPNAKYILYNEKTSTSTRDQVFKNASGKYTLCIDCHVLLCNTFVNDLLTYYYDHPDCKNLIQGPMIHDNLVNVYTHFKPKWQGDMYGVWATDEKSNYNEPFEIPMQGLGMFSCETKNWPGFNPYFHGFGGEEGYIHEKIRLNGGKTLCVPSLLWTHRFERVGGVPYRLAMEDRIWNYFLGWLELYQDINHPMILDIYQYFKDKCANTDNIYNQIVLQKPYMWKKEEIC